MELITLDFAFEWWIFSQGKLKQMGLHHYTFGEFCDKIKRTGYKII
jgi:hypothetical protein